MTRYFLHIQDGGHRIEDPDGAEYADLSAAHPEAVQGARDTLAQQLQDGSA